MTPLCHYCHYLCWLGQTNQLIFYPARPILRTMHIFRWIVQIGDITLVWNIWRITVLHHNHQIVMWHLMLVWNIWSSSLEFEIKVEDVTSDSRDGQADLSVRCGRNWQELDRGHSFYSSLTIFVRNIFKFNHFWRYFYLGPYSLFNVHWYRRRIADRDQVWDLNR